VGKTQRRETATEVSLLDRSDTVIKARFIPTDQSGALQLQNIMLNYAHGIIT
jgi:hypothetical protein